MASRRISARKQLEAASLHLAAIVEGSDDAIISKNLNGIITSWNKGAERIFGYTAEEVVGKPIWIIAAPGKRDEMLGILDKIRQGLHIEHYETLRRRKDGQTIHVSLSVSPVRDAAGRIIGASKIARDISDRKRIESELERSNEELRRANQDLETFAYSASHHLQEPLRTIALSAQLLERLHREELQGEARQLLYTIADGAKRMENLIRDILAYATATKYTGEPALSSINSAKALATALENLAGHIRKTGATITSGPLPFVFAHENRIAQVFQNLISNALTYKGTDPPRVHISAADNDGWAVFSVVDNGIGIDEEFASQIFQLLKRLHSRTEYPGSGIGLSICQRIVEHYGGRIWLENSVPGEGSTFCFTLPLVAA